MSVVADGYGGFSVGPSSDPTLLRSRDIVIGPTVPKLAVLSPVVEKRTEPLIAALYGGPGTGKSTTAALLFGALKQEGINVELVHEVAKDFTWEDRTFALAHQPYLMSKQLRNYDRLYGKVDVIVTDTSPLLASIYMPEPPIHRRQATISFLNWIKADWRSRDTLDVFLHRDPTKDYSTAGRRQSEEEATALDSRISRMLMQDGGEPFRAYVDKAEGSHVNLIKEKVLRCLRP